MHDTGFAIPPGRVIEAYAQQLSALTQFASDMQELGIEDARRVRFRPFTFETWVEAIHKDVRRRFPDVEFEFFGDAAVWRNHNNAVQLKRHGENGAELITIVRTADGAAWEHSRFHPMHGPRRYSIDTLTRRLVPEIIANALLYDLRRP